jgi:hypothetical protein
VQLPYLQLALDRFLAARPYHPCCLLVHPDVRRLQLNGEQIAASYRWPVLSLGTALSAALLPIAANQRSREAHAALVAAVQQHALGPVLCADIDLLFEPSLALDPLRLLRDSSRHATLMVLWPGSYTGSVLSYASAEPPHAHYRAWTRTDLSAESIIPL